MPLDTPAIKHVPGMNWVVSEHHPWGGFIDTQAEHITVQVDHRVSVEQARATVDLMAAAPALLYAGIKALALLKRLDQEVTEEYLELEGAIRHSKNGVEQ